METAPGSTDARRAVQRGDWIYGGHLLLAGSMALWRVIAATPGIAAADGGSFESSLVGRSLAMTTLFAGFFLLFVVATLSIVQWRDVRTSALSILLLLSIVWRTQVDAFDLAYIALVAVLSVVWFYDARPRLRSAAGGSLYSRG